MKIMVNICYGGFKLHKEFYKPFYEYAWQVKRDDLRIIERIEASDEYKKRGFVAGPSCGSKVAIVEIPDEVTDWKIDDYDGEEDIIAVLDGKIKYYGADGYYENDDI